MRRSLLVATNSLLLAVLCLVASSLFFSQPIFAGNTLDIGTNYRLRGVYISKPDYGRTDDSLAYYSQRLQAHVGGKFSPNLEFMTRFQALGVAGSTQNVTNSYVNQAGDRYPSTDFKPWIEWAYFKANQLYDWPVDITVGRQPITLGDGFLLSDDGLGFTGIRIQSRLPFYGLQSDLFTFKTGEGFTGATNKDIYGLEISKPTKNIRYSLMWLTEQDGTGSRYVRASEDASLTPLTDFSAQRITRSFYDGRIEGRLLEGGYYKAELALQNGKVKRKGSLDDVDLSGYGFLSSAGLYTNFSKYGPIELHVLFGLASGDKGEAGKDSAFMPSYGHRFDGIERNGFGEILGATLYDAYNTSGTVSGLPGGHSGIQVIGGGFTSHPTPLVSIGLDYYLFHTQQFNTTNFSTLNPEKSLGTEIDLGVGYAYTDYITFRFSYATFSPGKAFLRRERTNRISLEASGRF